MRMVHHDNQSDRIQAVRDERKRWRNRDMNNAQDLVYSVQMDCRGIAGTAIAYTRTDLIRFDSPFRPQQNGVGGAQMPAFVYGFQLEEDGVSDRNGIAGLVGHVKIGKWVRDANGYLIGCYADIGVYNMGADGEEIPYKGTATLQFTGGTVMTLDFVIAGIH